MDGLNNPYFQSVVILGLKTALLEAQDEINRIRKERDEARKKVLQLIQTNSKFQVEVINSNQLATKLKSMLKKLRNEFEEHKKEMTDKEHDNVNLDFKVKELKSLLDIKTELLESLNIKGDRVNKDEFNDYRANYKTLMRNLKLVIKNQPRYSDNQLLEDIQNVISKVERGKPANLSKYLVKRTKSDKEEINKCNDDDGKSDEISEDFGIRVSSSTSLLNCFETGNKNCIEKSGSNTVSNDCYAETEDLCHLDDDPSSKTNLVAEKTNEICDKPVIHVSITDMPQLSVLKDEKDIGTMSDSESDKTSGFCDIETEVESPPSMESSSHIQNTPSPENRTSVKCMPDLLLSINAEKSTPIAACNSTKTMIEKNTNSKTPISPNSKIVKDGVESSSPKKMTADLKNSLKVQNILEEMKTLKNTMICQASSLEQFQDDTSFEFNSCFKRPVALRSSSRESVRKSRNITEDDANFIPKRSSQLMKRDPCSRKKIADQVSDTELDKKLDPLISERNDTKTKSNEQSNVTRDVYNSACDTSAIENCEGFAGKKSSSCDFTSCFDNPLSAPKRSLPQLLTEIEISNTLDAKNSSNKTDLSLSVDEVVATKSESAESCQYRFDYMNVPIDNESSKELKNLHMDTLPCIDPVADVIDTDKHLGTEEQQDDVSTKEDNSIPDKRVNKVLSEMNSSGIDEKPSLVLTKESNNAPELGFDNLLSKKAKVSTDIDEKPKYIPIDHINIDEKPKDVPLAENNASEECVNFTSSEKILPGIGEKPKDVRIAHNNIDEKRKYVPIAEDEASEGCVNFTSSEKVLLDIDENPVSQSTDSSTSERKETIVISKSSNKPTASENTTTEEKIAEVDVPKKRKYGRTRKASSVTKPEPPCASNTSPKFIRRASTRLKTAASACNTKSTIVDLQHSNTMNNGMERRKRKGKFNEIIDSLKSKSKRRKSDFYSKSPELAENVKPVQRRDRKRKTSLPPVETLENASQKNWSPRLESMVSRITESISDLAEINTESEMRLEASLQNVQSKKQIDHQTSSATNKGSGYLSDEIPVVVESVDFVAQPENRSSSSALKSGNFVPNSLLGKLMNMSKIIQKKVSTVVESKQKIVPSAKDETCSFSEKEDVSEASSLATNRSESFPVSELGSELDHTLSLEPLKYVAPIKDSTAGTTCRILPILDAKSKQKYVANSSDSSESENDAESYDKSNIPTTSELESTSVVNSKQHQNLNSPNLSLEVETCEESNKRTENRETSASGNNLKQECVSSSSSESKNDEKVTSSKTETTYETDVIPSSDLERERVPHSSNMSLPEVENDEEEITSSSAETTCKTKTISSSGLKRKRISDTSNPPSPESENDRSPAKSKMSNSNQPEVTPFVKFQQSKVLNSTSKARNIEEPVERSIFDSEDDESPIEISSKMVSPVERILPECEEVRERCCVTSSWDIGSDDEPPTQVPFKKITAADEFPHDSNIISSPTTTPESQVNSLTKQSNDTKPEITPRVPYEEEFSNSSGLSSHVSELDANLEMISRFENVRTPPKVNDLFDSTDDENSNTDVFSILEEMASTSLRLSQKKHELVGFARRLSPAIAFEPVLAPPVIPSLEKYQMYTPPRPIIANESETKDEDDSEDETLIIAEDDQVNDSPTGGIEINKFNCHDTNYSYAFPAFTNSLTPSSVVNDPLSIRTASRNQTFTKQTPEKKIENGNQATGNNTIKFEFYKENVQTEKENGIVKALSPFESIWDNLKSLYVRDRAKKEKEILLPCYHSVPQLAFFYRIRKTDTKEPRVCADRNEVVRVEKLIDRYLENVRRNEYFSVKDFKMSVNSDSAAIAEALTSTVLKIANRNMKELRELLGYLSNLCVDLETDYEDFISEMQTTLRGQIFIQNWPIDTNKGPGQVMCIISMSVIFTMLSQRSNNLKSVKDLLLEALCSFKYRAHPIAFGVLNAWSTVFNDASRNCLLTQIILFSLLNHSMDRNLKLYKVIEVREMITQHYRVKLGDKTAEDHAKESMLLFDDDTWVDAIVLLCKRKLFPWSYTNVIAKYLLQIVDRWKEHDFNEIILIKTVQALHKILLSCPMAAVHGSNKAKEKSSSAPTKQFTYNINPITETLSNVLQSSKGSRELRETVAVAICGISHLNFAFCSETLSKWDPPEGVISNKVLEEMHLIMHRYRSYKPNAWLRVILPKDERPRTVANRCNFEQRKPNGGFSRPQQYPAREKNFANGKAILPNKNKKKKKKSKKNKHNPEQKIS